MSEPTEPKPSQQIAEAMRQFSRQCAIAARHAQDLMAAVAEATRKANQR